MSSLKRKELNKLKVTNEIPLEELTDINTLHWKTFNNILITDLISKISDDILYYRNIYKTDPFKFIIGCDSQRHGSKLIYVTTIVFQRVGHGGSCYYLREIESISDFLKSTQGIKNLRAEKLRALIPIRLWKETSKSIHCAQWLDQNILNKFNLKVDEIHADINTNSKYRSNEQLKSVCGYISSLGYTPIVKPDSWCASDISDQKTK